MNSGNRKQRLASMILEVCSSLNDSVNLNFEVIVFKPAKTITEQRLMLLTPTVGIWLSLKQ